MQDRHLCCPPYFFLGPAVPPHCLILESPLTVKAVKPGDEGSSERPGLLTIQQHRQDCSIVYAHLGGTRNGLLAPQWFAKRLHHI